MRAIKFRFWTGNKMYYDLDNVFACLMQQCAFNEGVLLPLPYDHVGLHGSVFMQFTGLKDKNGKEIYGGDILKRGDGISFVVWGLDGWRYNSWMPGSMGLYESVDNTRGKNYEIAEIIGNIHEHPELLNDR